MTDTLTLSDWVRVADQPEIIDINELKLPPQSLPQCYSADSFLYRMLCHWADSSICLAASLKRFWSSAVMAAGLRLIVSLSSFPVKRNGDW
jgi:hypothetical protein